MARSRASTPRGNPGKQCTARLVLSEQARVELVRDIFRLCVEGVGFKGIADELNRRGVMSPKATNRWFLSGVLRCGFCGQPFWGARKRKGRAYDRKEIVTSYYVCAGRIRSGKSTCPHPAHVRGDELEAFVLREVQKLILADGVGTQAAIDAFVASVHAQHGRADTGPIRREIAKIDHQVDGLMAGLDAANLTFLNAKLTELRRRKESLQHQLRAAEAFDLDEKALRTWAADRIRTFAEILGGRRDERARNAIASYVDEIVIDPATKTGYLVINAGAFPSSDEPTANDRPTSNVGHPQVTRDIHDGDAKSAPNEPKDQATRPKSGRMLLEERTTNGLISCPSRRQRRVAA